MASLPFGDYSEKEKLPVSLLFLSVETRIVNLGQLVGLTHATHQEAVAVFKMGI